MTLVVETSYGPAHVELDAAPEPRSLVVLTHGAGGGVEAADLSIVREEALAAGARAVLLCNPHNPTGTAHRPETLSALAEIAARHGAVVISDEIHAPLVYPGSQHVPYASLDERTAAHTITATSAMAGWP